MIADYAPPRSGTSLAAADETADLADLAFVWATLNALDSVEVDPADAPVVRASRASFDARLDDLGITSVDLFEHIADAVERGDWGALGFADEPD